MMTAPPTVADDLVALLRAHGVETVFSLIATSLLDLFDALAREPAVRVVVTQHEQAAAFMADGHARVTGRPALLAVSAGPGVTNAITGVAQAYHESSPVVVIASETSSAIHGRGRGNFHEVDQLSLFRPITKWATRVERPERAVAALRRAFHVATTGRFGPVYVGIPKDFLLVPGAGERPQRLSPPPAPNAPGPALDQAADLLRAAERPFILAGGGVIWSGAGDDLRRLAEALPAPVAATPWHRGILADDHPLGVGQLGNTGTRPALALAAEADVILVVGATLSELTTDRYSDRIIPSTARLVQIDVDPEEVGKNYPVEVGLVGDARTVLAALVERLGPPPDDWTAHRRIAAVAALKREWAAWLAERRAEDGPAPLGRLTVYEALRRRLDRDAIVVAESGGTAAYTRFALPAYLPQIFPGDYSAMGSGFCMALGAKVAHPARQVVSLSGDGAFMMVLPELQTAVEQGIDVTALIFHNDSYANMRYKQARLFDGRYLGVDFRYPDFAAVAAQFGARGIRVAAADELDDALADALARPGPTVVDLITDPRDQVPPSAIYRRWIQERQMEPV